MSVSQYIGQAEAEHAELLELRAHINACLQVTEISNKEHNKKNARIAELEAALHQAQSLLRSTQSNWNEQAYFDADTVITNALGK